MYFEKMLLYKNFPEPFFYFDGSRLVVKLIFSVEIPIRDMRAHPLILSDNYLRLSLAVN